MRFSHKYEEKLSISYYYKKIRVLETLELRNEKKQGDYFIIFDSDCIIQAVPD
jgi:hypothetical protein